MFRSVVYGACLRNGDPPPSLTRQKELADELRAKVIHSLVVFIFHEINSFYFGILTYLLLKLCILICSICANRANFRAQIYQISFI
jgi:hypothetical protein